MYIFNDIKRQFRRFIHQKKNETWNKSCQVINTYIRESKSSELWNFIVTVKNSATRNRFDTLTRWQSKSTGRGGGKRSVTGPEGIYRYNILRSFCKIWHIRSVNSKMYHLPYFGTYRKSYNMQKHIKF